MEKYFLFFHRNLLEFSRCLLVGPVWRRYLQSEQGTTKHVYCSDWKETLLQAMDLNHIEWRMCLKGSLSNRKLSSRKKRSIYYLTKLSLLVVLALLSLPGMFKMFDLCYCLIITVGRGDEDGRGQVTAGLQLSSYHHQSPPVTSSHLQSAGRSDEVQ